MKKTERILFSFVKKASLTLILSIICFNMVYAQCTIQSGDFACVDDIIGFSVTSSAGINSVAWKFGDGNSSTTKDPNHRYASAGSFTVTATILQTNGSSCEATKKIDVYNAPDVKLQLDATSVFCLTQNNVCIVDNSTSGNTTTTNTKRIVLWGDGGKTDKNNPSTGDKICYTYQQAGKYSIDVELTNNKGCETIGTLDVEVLDDFEGTFNTGRLKRDCEYQKNWFALDTSWIKRKNEIALAEIDYGDGERDTIDPIDGNQFDHDFKKNGNYSVFVIITFKNGCQTRFKRTVGVSLDKVDINHSKSDSALCYGNTFEFSHPNVSGASFIWTALDTAGNVVQMFGGQRVAYFTPPNPGKFYIEIRIKKGDCISYKKDSIEVLGVKAKARILNASQCEPKDTVYFCDASITHRTNDISYLWKFQDQHAAPCTTDTKNGQNKNKNCNYSVDQNAKHLYDTTMCDEVWLTAVDNDHGCSDSVREYVIIKKPVPEDFASDPRDRCLLSQVEFTVEGCYDNLQINYDSMCGKNQFQDYRTAHIYKTTCDSTRWVTWGIVAITGDEKVYHSCDTSDYTIEPDRVCSDTFWFHKDFQLNPAPRPQAKLNFNGCLPSDLVGSFYVQEQKHVTDIFYDWGDGSYDTALVSPDSTTLPNFTHRYTTSGDYSGSISMLTDSGCEATVFFDRKIGFYNKFSFKKPVCPGAVVQFKDSIIYWGDTNQYWRWTPPDQPMRPEKVHWDFDDGAGFSGHQVEPTHIFNKPGTYTVRMASVDETGCSDTSTQLVVVENIQAGIKDLTKKFVCDDILQLFDSSTVADTVFDKIVNFYWDFGDGKTPSFLKDPFHYYSSYGNFSITHVVENVVGCRDTIEITIDIDGPLPHFDILSDTVACVPHTVTFQNNSTKASDYIWYFGDTSSASNSLSTKSDTNVTFTYQNPGIYYIYLYAGDSVVNPDNGNNIYYCNSTFPDTNALVYDVRRVVILPIPPVDFTTDGSLCKGTSIDLVDLSDSIYKTYRWYYGNDSAISNIPTTTISLNDTGSITIAYRPTYEPSGPYQRRCYDSITKTFNIFENEASFDFTQDSICPTFHFSANHKHDDLLEWNFGHTNSGHRNLAFEPRASHNYAPDIGEFDVCLYSLSAEGCWDTLCKTVESNHHFKMMIPNIITPNDDGLNDRFEIEMEGEDFYELSIFNRWGERVYFSNRDFEANSMLNWDATVQGSGKTCPAGTYFYILKFREACIDEAMKEKYSGTITVVYD